MSTQLDTFNQYLAEKEKKKDEKEEKRIQALQEMKELEIRKEEHEIMTTDISLLDPQTKAYYTMRKNEIFAKWSANGSSPNNYFPMPPDE